ncbi:MAG: hypothetical protein FJ368_06605 [Pelagibacterales bacterium]|nr:hypothetical protein [Pelagibacterales bacterium]
MSINADAVLYSKNNAFTVFIVGKPKDITQSGASTIIASGYNMSDGWSISKTAASGTNLTVSTPRWYFQIGGRFSGTGYDSFYQGYLSEIIVFDSVLSDADHKSI